MNELGGKLEDLKIERPAERAGIRWWIPITIGLIAAALIAFWWWSRPRQAAVQTAAAREVSVGGQRTVLNASGYVTARRQATVSSKVTGKVVEVLIEEGMVVEQGQLLARLDAANATVSLRLAQAQEAAARSELEEIRVRRAEAELNRQRVQNLVEQRIASQSEFDRAQAEVDSLAARLNAQSRAVEVATNAVRVARQGLDDTEILAPFAGVVVAKNAQPGEMISPMSAGGGFTRTGIGTIVDMDSLEVEVDVNEAYINRVVPGQRVTAVLDSYSDWQIPAQVIAIIPTADRQTATVQVRIGFDELDPRILPDMGVKVAFQGGEGEDDTAQRAIAVPRSAVRRVAGRDLVFVVKDGRLERRAVALGDEVADEIYVLSGVAAGERVVTEGPETMTDGQRVKESEA